MSTGNNRKPAAKIGGGFQPAKVRDAIQELFIWGSANDYRKELNYFLGHGKRSKHYQRLTELNRSSKRFAIFKIMELITALESLVPDPFTSGRLDKLLNRVTRLKSKTRRKRLK